MKIYVKNGENYAKNCVRGLVELTGRVILDQVRIRRLNEMNGYLVFNDENSRFNFFFARACNP